MASNGFLRVVKMGQAPLSRALREIKQLFCEQSLFLYYIKQIDSMLPCICPVIDHRGRQNVVRTSLTHSAIASCATFLFLPHFDVICDLLKDRCTATWNLFVNYIVTDIFKYCFVKHSKIYIIQTKTIVRDRREGWQVSSAWVRRTGVNCAHIQETQVGGGGIGFVPIFLRGRS